MTNNGNGETYDAFKARKRQEFNSRHGGRTHIMQQKLLRVHLQHFLLNVGATFDRNLGRVEETCTGIENHGKNCTSHVDEVAASQSYASEQKRLAIAREAAKAERHRSARAIQKFVRRRQNLQKGKAIENEEELPSTSVLLAFTTEKASVYVEPTNESFLPVVDDIPVIPFPKPTLPPYEVMIELIGARDLALDVAALNEKYIETELILKRKSAVIERVVPTKQFVSSFQESRAELQLHDCSLRFSLDLNNGMRHGLVSPQSVIDELMVTIIIKITENNSGSNAITLGVVEIPLSLLETPLATEYALCRWFPLEKAHPGHTARGDLRVSVCYLMRQTNSDNVTMVPYVNTASSQNTSDEVEVQQQREKPINRKAKSIPQKKATGKSLQRNRTLQSTEKKAGKTEKLKPPVLSLKDTLSSPIGRISRAEALSPPPSPSSVASSETGESVESPRTERPVKTNRRFFSSKRQQKYSKPVENSSPKEEFATETKTNSSQLPSRNFLKRKPYKVVFHKLDWTGVGSKTDSNLPTSGTSSRTHSGVASRSSKASRSSSKGPNSTVTTSTDGYAGTTADFCINPKPGAFIDAATAQRLATLETAIYEQCGVTPETASLARFKYQTDRKKFVATLQSQAQSRQRNIECTIESPNKDSSEHGICTTSEAAISELWKKLTSDLSGQMYASMLRGLIERPAKTIESAESVS